jgi:hypothetical protein
VLQGSAAPDEAGYRITLALADARTGQTLRVATGSYAAAGGGGADVGAANNDVGALRSALELRLDRRLDLRPILAYAKEMNYAVADRGDVLVWSNLGMCRDRAYIGEDGRILIVSGLPIAWLRDKDRLVNEAVLVTTTIGKVNAEVQPYDRWAGYRARFYSDEGGVAKTLLVRKDLRYGDSLAIRVDVPDCQVREARILVGGLEAPYVVFRCGSVTFDGRPIPGAEGDSHRGDITTSLRFRSHTLKIDPPCAYSPHLMVAIEAVTSPTRDNISAGIGNDYVPDCIPCFAISELKLPLGDGE